MYAAATHYGEMAYASGGFVAIGDAQASVYVMRDTTTDATMTELFLNGTNERLTIASNRAMAFDILIVARSDDNSSAGYRITGVIERDGGTTHFVGSPDVTTLGENVVTWDAAVIAYDSHDALGILVTGANATTIRWVASVRTTEVAWRAAAGAR